jgi:hypothetical protein
LVATQLGGEVLFTQQAALFHTAPVRSDQNDHGMMPQQVSRQPTTHGDRGIGYALKRMLRQAPRRTGALP